MARPTLIVELGLTDDVSVSNFFVDWTDISSHVLDASWSGGKEHALNQVERSECYVSVNNNFRAFDPVNTSSPYYPNLKPRARIRIGLTWASTTYYMFTGFIKDISVHWEFRSQVVLHGVDALALFNQARCYESPWEMVIRKDVRTLSSTQKVHWYRLGDGGAGLCKDSISNYDGSYQGEAKLGQPAIIVGSSDASFSPQADTRASIPRKDLITTFPFTVEFWLKINEERTAGRYVLAAFNGPLTHSQNVQIRIHDTGGGGADAGKVYCEFRNGATNGLANTSGVIVDDGDVHHVVWRVTNSTTGVIYVDGVSGGTQGILGTPSIPTDLSAGYAIGNTPAVVWGDFRLAFTDDEVLDEVVIWDGLALSAGQITEHYDAGSGAWAGETPKQRINHIVTTNTDFSTLDRTLSDGVSPISGVGDTGSVLTAIQKVAETDEGIIFVSGAGYLTYYGRDRVSPSVATFGVTPPDLPYHAPVDYSLNDEDLYNEVEVSRVITNGINVDVNSVPQISRDLTSQSAYDRNVLSKTDLLHTSDAECKDHADWLLLHYKEPVPRTESLTINPDLNPTGIYPIVLAINLHDRITLKIKPEGGGSTFTQDQYIEGYQWSMDRENIQVTYSLSPAFVEDYYFILDDFTYGLLDSNDLAF